MASRSTPEDTDAARLVAVAQAAAAASPERRTAFGQLMAVHMPAAAQLARRLTWSRDAADDCVQEAALQAYLSLDRLRDPGAFHSWLFAIVANVARRHRQRRWQEPDSVAEITGGTLVPPTPVAPAPDQQLELDELGATVAAAIDELSPALRDVAWRFYMESLSPQEVAHQLQLSRGAVRTRLHRARTALRSALLGRLAEARPGGDSRRGNLRQQPERRSDMVNADVYDVMETTAGNIVLLRQRDADCFVPIFVDRGQALALSHALMDTATPRPLTSVLTHQLLEAAGARLVEARVDRIVDNVYYSTLVVATAAGERREVDARPSDALCLAALAKCSIKLGAEVIESSSFSAGVEIRRPALSYVRRLTDLKQTVARLEELRNKSEVEKEPALDWFREYVSGA